MARGGRGGLSFNVEQLGFSRGELPAAVLTPPPLFPPLVNKPLPIELSERINDFVRCKKELRYLFSNSEYYIKPKVVKKSVEKYSDRNVVGTKNAVTKIDWSRCPKELRVIRKKQKKTGTSRVKLTTLKNIDVESKLKALEQKENADLENDEEEEDEKQKEDDDDEPEADEEDYDDEEQEEGTDYVSSYFDNGENYLDEDDDNLDDGPTY